MSKDNPEKHSPIEPETNQLFCGRCGKPAIRGKNIGDHCGQFFDIEKNGMFCSGTIVEPDTPLQPVKEKDFEDYILNARNSFVAVTKHYFPHEKKPIGLDASRMWTGMRVACEAILIAYDQMKDKLLSSPPEPSSKEQEGDAVGFAECEHNWMYHFGTRSRRCQFCGKLESTVSI